MAIRLGPLPCPRDQAGALTDRGRQAGELVQLCSPTLTTAGRLAPKDQLLLDLATMWAFKVEKGHEERLG
jgi:hypothetical protein